MSNLDSVITKNQNKWADLYKMPIKRNSFSDSELSQETRRKELLIHQKKNRDMIHDMGRKLLNETLRTESEMEEVTEEFEQMEVEYFKKKSRRRLKKYSDVLMLSEWMMAIPEDLESNWFMVPCPAGQRVIIIACNGQTKAYTRKGFYLGKFKSALPGGNTKNGKKKCTILDCIWVKACKTYYVLDILAWSNQSMINCDVEFRFYWIKSNIADTPDLQKPSEETNHFSILALPSIPCGNLYDYFSNFSAMFPLDGFLFYHKGAHYNSGKTPLVLWLKPYMISEVFNVSNFDYEKPDDYGNFEHHLSKLMSKKSDQET